MESETTRTEGPGPSEPTETATLPTPGDQDTAQTSNQGTDSGAKQESPLSPELIDQLLLDDLGAIREKVNRKQPLSTAEIKRLQAYKSASLPDVGPNVMEPVWARSQVELAKHLPCSRRQLQRYLKLEGDDAPPAPTSDGRYNVTLWKIWAQEHGHLKSKLSSLADRQLLEDRTITLRNERLEIDNAVRRGELLDVDEVCRIITEMVSGAKDGALAMTHGTAPRLAGLPVPEITKRLRIDLNESFFGKLSLGDWAKKKLFWAKVSAHLSDLRKRFNLGDGLNVTS